ncbi:MAG: iron-sulfur cluster assembly accessory protein [Gammaproteobacteria bacterium]|nr:iron-sulfur cluster assembly accessory protein [Gammaproteobacteria bacterium]
MSQTGIALTERAAAHVKNHLAKHGAQGLRLGVKPTGCSGYQYVVEAAEKVNAGDQTFESNGVQVVVDAHSLQYLAGTELDYVREGLNSGFRFNNPNVQETCGCGESFSVAGDAAR